MRVFYNWLEREQYIKHTPFNKSVKFKTKAGKTTVIKSVSSENLVKIFTTLTDPERIYTFTGVRDLALFSLLLDSGMRRGELLSLQLPDLNIANLRCTIRGKTGQRHAYFSDKCKGVLLDYLKFRVEVGDKTGPLWLTVEGEPLLNYSFGSIIGRLKLRSGVKDFHVHQLRHTFALMMSQKVSTFELRDMLGHASIWWTPLSRQSNKDY